MARTIAKDHADKRQHIQAAAAKVFAGRGFDRASVADVAKECSISKANVYHYYASKDDILFDILNAYLRTLRDKIIEKDRQKDDPRSRFFATVTNILLAYHGSDYEHKLQVNGLAQLPKEKQKILKRYQSDMVKHLSGIIEQIAPNRFASQKNELRSVTMSVFGMLNWYYMWNREGSKDARIAYAKTVCDLTLNGILR